MSKTAFIGLGVMGASMAKHLIKCGHEVNLYNRTGSKAEKVQRDAGGGAVCHTIAEAVKDADFIFTIVGYPAEVEAVYLNPDGILPHGKRGAIAADMTTSNPSLAQKLFEEGRKKGIGVLDAPVSGGDSGARNATLSIMAGGDEGDYEKAKPLFECMGKNIMYMGPAGFGQHTKAANQIAIAGATAAYTEALVYARHVGLDAEKMLNVIGSGAAGSWQITNMAPRVLKRDLAPGFFVKHFVKDMLIVREEMASRGITLQMLNTVLEMYEKMMAEGLEEDGTQALIKLYEQ